MNLAAFDIVNPPVNFLDYEIPWIVPEAFVFLQKNIRAEDKVLDLGSGGSTFYYSKNTASTVSFETDEYWAYLVKEKINRDKITNIDYIVGERDLIFDYLEKDNLNFTIISIDTAKPINRSLILEKILAKNDSISIIVLDNFASYKVFKNCWSLSKEEFIQKYKLQDYFLYDFLHPQWLGSGTRILIHKNR